MNFTIISLGCGKNLVDSERMVTYMTSCHFNYVPEIEDANIIILNTCGFIAKALEEAYETIEEINSLRSPGSVLVVTGCLVSRFNEKVRTNPRLEGVDAFIPIKDYHKFGEYLLDILPKELFSDPYSIVETPRTPSDHNHAYIRIADGCNNHCSFCTIAAIRGKYVSRPIEEIVQEVRMLALLGVSEFSIVAQDTTLYGSDIYGSLELPNLLRQLELIPGVICIRVHYLYPSDITDEMIQVIGNSRVIAPYFDIPFQHASDSILTSMKRRGTHQDYLNLFKRIKELSGNQPIIRGTFIVGYPGESEQDFDILCDFIRDSDLNHIAIFSYSPEPSTIAASLPNQVPDEIKEDRHDRLLDVAGEKIMAWDPLIGYRTLAIIEEKLNDKTYLARVTVQAFGDIDGHVFIETDEDTPELEIGRWVYVEVTSWATDPPYYWAEIKY